MADTYNLIWLVEADVQSKLYTRMCIYLIFVSSSLDSIFINNKNQCSLPKNKKHVGQESEAAICPRAMCQ